MFSKIFKKKNEKWALADRWQICTPQWRPVPSNQLAHADFFADSRLAVSNSSVSRPASDANRLAAIGDALTLLLMKNCNCQEKKAKSGTE